MKVSWDDYSQLNGKIKKSKPPTREHIMIINDGANTYSKHYNQIDHDLHQKISLPFFRLLGPCGPRACNCATTSRALGTLSQGAIAKNGNSGTNKSPPQPVSGDHLVVMDGDDGDDGMMMGQTYIYMYIIYISNINIYIYVYMYVYICVCVYPTQNSYIMPHQIWPTPRYSNTNHSSTGHQ